MNHSPLCLLAGVLAWLLCSASSADPLVTAADYPTIQSALAAQPRRAVYVPAGDHVITERIRIRGDGSGLYGPGRIIQKNPREPILEIENASSVEIRDLTLTRAEGDLDTNQEAIIARKCRDLAIENVRVIDNRTRAGAITLGECRDARISRCLIRNYMRVSIDDRTKGDEIGFAFHCIDGTGISVQYCTGTLIESNRVIEENLRPTPEMRARHKLGDFARKNPRKDPLMSQTAWDAGHVDNWHQGSGILVTAPATSDFTRILGNHIENAAQGIDLHCDHAIVSGNVILNSFMGMKAMHGSRNVLIAGNQFSRNDLWAIGLMPGAAADAANADGGSIIAHNIISDFGHGDSHWIWGDERSPIKFDSGQEPDDPPLTDVVIQGNLIHNIQKPRYSYAVIISKGPNGPRGLHFSNNLFPPGSRGVANVELQP